MEQVKGFLKRKNIVISAKRYGIDALGAMAQGLFCSLLIGTILNTIGTQFHIGFLTAQVITINGVGYTIGGLASFMSGSAMAVAIGYALQAPPMVLFSLVTVGYACNALGGAGGPLAVLFVAIIAAEVGKAISKETKVDILVTPIVTILVGVGAAWIIAPPIGGAASAFGQLIMRTTELQPFFMGVLVSVLVGIALTLPVFQTTRGADFVSCAIRKDSGDDPDATRDTLIFASVRKTDAPGVFIDGGAGVGRVTKRGLDQPVGAAAINSVPRRMIEENVCEVCKLCDYHGGISVIISVPDGERLAQKTFNPRLGITGGISILGTCRHRRRRQFPARHHQ